MSKNKDEEKIIMRHILEVRVKKRLFSFMDFRGRMIEYMTNALSAEQIKLQSNGIRFDVADDKLENLYFFSIENFGFQSELKTSFEDFSNDVKKFLDVLKKFPEYKINEGLVRVGTKSIILYHRKFDTTQSIKDSYRELLVNNHEILSKFTNSKIIDTAHTVDFKLEKSTANVLTGPVTKEEALIRFFDDKKEYSEHFTRDNGMLLVVDVFGDNPLSITGFDALENQIYAQIVDIKAIFDGFKKLFTTEIAK